MQTWHVVQHPKQEYQAEAYPPAQYPSLLCLSSSWQIPR